MGWSGARLLCTRKEYALPAGCSSRDTPHAKCRYTSSDPRLSCSWRRPEDPMSAPQLSRRGDWRPFHGGHRVCGELGPTTNPLRHRHALYLSLASGCSRHWNCSAAGVRTDLKTGTAAAPGSASRDRRVPTRRGQDHGMHCGLATACTSFQNCTAPRIDRSARGVFQSLGASAPRLSVAFSVRATDLFNVFQGTRLAVAVR